MRNNTGSALLGLNTVESVRHESFSPCFRAAQFLKVLADPTALQESQTLSINLAQQNKIRMQVKEDLSRIPGHEDLLADIVNLCLHLYEAQMFLEPSEKYMLVKVRVFRALFHKSILVLS